MDRDPDIRFARDNPGARTERDIKRLRGREPGDRFWRWVALTGSVGWPVALLGAGGALLGRTLDGRWGTGVKLTFMLLSIGVALGTFAAFRALRGTR